MWDLKYNPTNMNKMNTTKKHNPHERFEDIELIDRTLKNFKVPQTMSDQEALLRVKSRIALGGKVVELPVRTKNNMLYYISAAAATVLFLFGLWYTFLYPRNKELFAQRGQHNEYQLPDGSEVAMNAESKISYKEKNFNKNRNIRLEGEAFFKIQKGKTFTIVTRHAEIKVLGTSFNVYARDNSFKVCCFTGKIMITANNQSVIITPGESVELKDNSLQKYSERDMKNVANWRSGEFYFENASLITIFEEIERQYNVNFVLPEMENKYFTGSFSNANLVDALDIVCIPMKLTYEIGSNSTITIHEKPH
jgi:transmembrane sensor